MLIEDEQYSSDLQKSQQCLVDDKRSVSKRFSFITDHEFQ